MDLKQILLISGAVVVLFVSGLVGGAIISSDGSADGGTFSGNPISAASFWKKVSGILQPINSSDSLRIPSLTNCDTIDTDADGDFSCGTDGGGGGAGSGTVSTSTALVDTYVTYATGVDTIGAEAAFTYDDATDLLTVVNASTTNLTSTYASSTAAHFGTLNLPNLSAGMLAIYNNIVGSYATTTFSSGLTYSGGNVTADLGTSIDISDETNLVGTANEIVLTDDTLSIHADIARDSELHSAVTLSGTLDYITLVGQDIVRAAIDLATDITGTLAIGNGGTGATTLNDLITLTTHTTGNYVASITNGSGITGGDGGSEGAGLTIAATLGTSIDTSEIDNGTILANDLSTTTTFLDGEIIKYVAATDNFTSVTCAEITGSADLCDGSDDGAGGTSEWTDGGTILYPNEQTDQVAIGTSTPTALTSLTVQATSSDTTKLFSLVGNNGIEDSYFDSSGDLILNHTDPYIAGSDNDGGIYIFDGVSQNNFIGITDNLSISGGGGVGVKDGSISFTNFGDTSSSGNPGLWNFSPTIAQSGTAAYRGLNIDVIESSTGSGTGYPFYLAVDSSPILTVDSLGNLDLAASSQVGFNGTAILSDSAGTLTLSNVDAIDATTETTFETAIDALSNLTTVGTITSGTWNATIQDGLIVEPDLNADNSPNDGDILTYDSTGTNFVWQTAAQIATFLESALEAVLDINQLQGTLTVANGGTGVTTFGGNNHILYTTAADTLGSEADFSYNASNNTLSLNTIVSGAQIKGSADGANNPTFSWNGDEDTGIYKIASNQVGITTGNSLTLGIGTASTTLLNGNFGIGTTSPYAKLSVVGETVASNFTATTSATSTLPNLIVGTAIDLFGTYATSLSDLCVAITGGAGLCDGTDATGAGGAAAVATSTNETAGNLAYWTSTSGTPATLGEVATSSITYNSPLTTSGTAGYIVGGSGFTLDVATTTNSLFTGTAGQVLGYTASGWTGVATTTFSSGLTYSGGNVTADLGTAITSSEITNDEIVNADINSAAAIDISKTALVAGTNITLSTNTLNVDDAFLLLAGDTSSSNYIFTGTIDIDSGELLIPVAADPTVGTSGELAINSTAASSSIRFHDGTAERALYDTVNRTFTIASTTLQADAGATASSTIPLGVASKHGETWQAMSCFTDSAGTAELEFGDGTNWMDYQLLTTSVLTDSSLSNNTFTAFEKRYVRVGQTASNPDYITCDVEIRINAD